MCTKLLDGRLGRAFRECEGIHNRRACKKECMESGERDAVDMGINLRMISA